MRKILSLITAAILACGGMILPAVAAVTYVGAGAAVTDNAGNPITPNTPTGTAIGNQVGICAGVRAAETLATPSGWTRIEEPATPSLVLFMRTWQSGDSMPSLDWSGTAFAWATSFAFSGATLTEHTAANSSGSSTTNITINALTITEDNTVVIACGILQKTADSNGATITTPSPFTEINESVTNGSQLSAVAAYSIQTTATNISADNFVVSVAETAARTTRSIITSLSAAATTPTFTSAPAIGTRTTSSIPVNFTSDTTGTVYGARLTDGSATPTCDQLEAQTATGGVQYFSEAVVATVADSATFGSITDGTLTDGYFCIEDGSGNDSAVASIANMYKLPAFTVNPSISAQDDNDYTITKTLDGAGTVYAVACAKDQTAPTVTQVEAGNCTGDVAAIATANDDATGTFVLGGALARPIHDIYVVGTYGSQHEASVHMFADECLDAQAGEVYINGCPTGLASVGTSSTNPIKLINDSETPDVAAGDICQGSSTNSPQGDIVTWDSAGDYTVNSNGSRFNLTVRCYDVSAGGNFAWNDATIWVNDGLQSCLDFEEILNKDSATTAFDMEAGLCTDPEADDLTFAVTAGTLTPNLAISSAGSRTGTPINEVEAGNAVTVTVTSAVTGATATFTYTTFIFDTVTLPNCVGQTLGDCDGLLVATNAGLSIGTVTLDCGAPVGQISAQNPAASTEVEPLTSVSVTILRSCGLTKKLGVSMRLGL